MADYGTSTRELMKGNYALCEGAIRAGARFYCGYPITPQNEVPEYMSARMPEVGGTFLQAESELGAINMIYGASAAGARAITTSSSPGISLMQEGISYTTMAELPCVIGNIVRAGPGLGNIAPHQGDYFQAVKGGGHGDYKLITLAPASVQEIAEFTYMGFDIADKYRNPVMILADGVIGQMMEAVDFSTMPEKEAPFKEWSLRPRKPGEKSKFITTIALEPEVMAEVHKRLIHKYETIKRNEVRYEAFMTDDAELLLVAFGTVSRACRSAIRRLRADGVKVGMLRPITVFPFPYKQVAECAKKAKAVLTAEMNFGQMVEDVALSVGDSKPLHFVGKHGGMLFESDELERAVRTILANPKNPGTLFKLHFD